ncbi:MAG: sigma-70 family RNA polymerase sigma factor, partial [Deltaproteobacteria bacterium]|nr:sigma-70 family RNA polymerase sigma factor [Deltaproteobacteria bacterium]
ELTARLRPFVARRVAPADVDDVLQEIFLRVQTNLVHLRDAERFGPWVYQVARSAIIDHHRAASRHAPPRDAEAPEPIEEAVAPSDAEDAEAEVCRCIAPFVARLPSPYREAITLTELEGLGQNEAALLVGASPSAMKSRVQRGRERLRAMFLACCEIALDPRGRVIGCAPKPAGSPSGGCGIRS